MTQTTDYLIIGGGIPALICAEHLVHHGCDVLLVDDDRPSASPAGAGILSPLPPWRYDTRLRQLAAAGAAAYPQILKRLGDDCGWHKSGLLIFSETPDEPTATCLPEVAQISPPHLIAALRRQLGNRRKIAAVTAILHKHQTVIGAALNNNTVIRARHIILSAGVWSQHLCPPPAPNIFPCRGQIIFFRHPDIRLPHILLRDTDTFYLVQRRDGSLLAGSTNEYLTAADVTPTDITAADNTAADNTANKTATDTRVVATLYQKAKSLFPTLPPPDRTWSGIRPMSADDHPITARHPTIKNLYLNTAHGRYGVTTAPATAHTIHRQIITHETHNDAVVL